MAIRKSGLNSQYPSGSTGNRPAAPAEGYLYFNTTLGSVQIYMAGLWSTYITPPTPAAPTIGTATDVPSGRAYNNLSLIHISEPTRPY